MSDFKASSKCYWGHKNLGSIAGPSLILDLSCPWYRTDITSEFNQTLASQIGRIFTSYRQWVGLFSFSDMSESNGHRIYKVWTWIHTDRLETLQGSYFSQTNGFKQLLGIYKIGDSFTIFHFADIKQTAFEFIQTRRTGMSMGYFAS